MARSLQELLQLYYLWQHAHQEAFGQTLPCGEQLRQLLLERLEESLACVAHEQAVLRNLRSQLLRAEDSCAEPIAAELRGAKEQGKKGL